MLINSFRSCPQIDKIGRVINLEKNKSKLAIIQKEFLYAENLEREKQRNEEEARRQVRARRVHSIEESRRLARAHRAREGYKTQRAISTASREAKGLTTFSRDRSLKTAIKKK